MRCRAVFLQHFMGAGNAALLGVDAAADGLLFGTVSLFGELLTGINRDAAIANAAEKVSKLLINSTVLVARGGERPTFAIPDQLKQQWGVNGLG